MIYSPEFRTTYVTGNAVFHSNLKYDGSLANHNAADIVKQTKDLPTESIDKYKYLEGTSHLDPDNGLLYRVMRVEERTYKGQGKFIVAFRSQILSDGKVSSKCERDGYHIRDI